MWSLELRLVLFALVLYTLLVFLVGRWTARRKRPSFDPTPLGFVRVRLDGRYVAANRAACRSLGLPNAAGTLPDAEWRALLEEDLRAVWADRLGRTRLVTTAAGQALRWWAIPGLDDIWLFVTDAGESHRGLQKLRRLLAGLAHELRTPLATILTHLEVLKIPSLTPERCAQSLQVLEEETLRMLRMVHNVLDLGRLSSEALIFQPLHLVEVVQEALAEKMLDLQARQQTLSVEIEEELPLALGDADRLKQVFLNLLDNACRYSRSGDRITVALRRVPEGIACEVADTGPGIPSAHLPYVTEPFYRGDVEEISGSGLGLAIVAEILRQHHTELEIESHTEGETGTKVRFILPIWEDD